MDALHLLLEDRERAIQTLRQQAEVHHEAQQRLIEGLQSQAAELRLQAATPLVQLGSLQEQMRAKQEAWDKQKMELESQADRMMELLRGMGILADGGADPAGGSDGGAGTKWPAGPGAVASERARPQSRHVGKPDYGLTAPDAQALHIKELSILLAEAREQAEGYRRQLAARMLAPEDLTRDLKRLKADNQRLVALLSRVPEYRGLAAEVAAESGVHYIPLEECLMLRGLVEDLYPPMIDRPVEDVTGGDAAGAGRRRDPDAADPSLTLVLDEQYHWVPRKALETGAALMRRMMPALPISQLLVLVAELNKVWRDRERQRLAEVTAAHREELRQLKHSFQQRAPYEAVVAGQTINDLKRRLRTQAAEAAAAAKAAKKGQRQAEEDSKVMLHAGLSSIQDLSKQVAKLVTRNNKLASKASRQRALAAAAAAANARADPLSSVYLDRLLRPPGELGAAPEHGADPIQLRRQELLNAPQPGAITGRPQTPSSYAGATDAERQDAGLAEQDGPRGLGHGRVAGQQPIQLERRSGSEAAWPQPSGLAADQAPVGSADRYPAATRVHVNIVPPSALARSVGAPPPSQLPPDLTPIRHVGSAAATAAASGVSLQPHAVAAGEARDLGQAEVQVESDMGALTITAPGAVLKPQRTAGDGGGSTNVELSTASLAEWRQASSGAEGLAGGNRGGGEGSPVRVNVRLGAGSSSPGGVTVRQGNVSGAGSDGGLPAGGTGSAPAQVRGAPVTVRVRFPRHDVTINPTAEL